MIEDIEGLSGEQLRQLGPEDGMPDDASDVFDLKTKGKEGLPNRTRNYGLDSNGRPQ